MGNIRLTDQVQWLPPDSYEYEVELREGPPDLSEAEVEAAIREAQLLGGSDVLGADLAKLTSRTITDPETLDRFRHILRGLREDGWGREISRDRVLRRISVVAAAAPNTAGAEVDSSFSFTRTTKRGLKVSLGVVTFGLKANTTISTGIDLTCNAGEAKVGQLVIPLHRVVQEWTPPSGSETFERVRYEPLPKSEFKIGTASAPTTIEELMEARVPPPTDIIASDDTHTGTESRTVEVDIELTIGPKFGPEDANSLSVTAGVNGKITADIEYTVPTGSYQLHPLRHLGGGYIVPT